MSNKIGCVSATSSPRNSVSSKQPPAVEKDSTLENAKNTPKQLPKGPPKQPKVVNTKANTKDKLKNGNAEIAPLCGKNSASASKRKAAGGDGPLPKPTKSRAETPSSSATKTNVGPSQKNQLPNLAQSAKSDNSTPSEPPIAAKVEKESTRNGSKEPPVTEITSKMSETNRRPIQRSESGQHIGRILNNAPPKIKLENSNYYDLPNNRGLNLPRRQQKDLNTIISENLTTSNKTAFKNSSDTINIVEYEKKRKTNIVTGGGLFMKFYDGNDIPDFEIQKRGAGASLKSAGSKRSITASYFSRRSRLSTVGPIGAIVQAATTTSKSGIDPTGEPSFADKIVHADGQRYNCIFPEDEDLPFPVSALSTILMLVLLILMLVFGDDNGVTGFAPVEENPMLGPTFWTMVRFGGNVAVWMQESLHDNWWRMVTASFLHAGFVHLFVNSSALFIMGPKMDRWYGVPRIILVFMTCAVGSTILESIVRKERVVSVGASGCICGFMGAIIGETIKNWECINLPWFQLGYWGLNVALFLGFGFLPMMNNIVHTGGLVTGIFAGFAFLPKLIPLATTPGVLGPKRSYSGYLHALWTFIGVFGLLAIFGGGLALLAMGKRLEGDAWCYAFFSTTC